MLRRRYGTFHDDSVAMSLPATKIRPCSGVSSLFTRRRNVDLPEPDAPTRKTNSPFSMSTVASLQGDDLALVDLGDVLELDHGRRRGYQRPLSDSRHSGGRRNIAIRLRRARRAAPLQVGLHERIEVAVEHALDVAGLVLGPQVLHHLVRLQHVAADLAAEADPLLLAPDAGQLVLPLLALEVGQARP